MDRLLFIRRVREAEEAGEISAMSLSDLRSVFDSVSPELVAKVAQGRWPINLALPETPKRHHRRAADRRIAREAAWSAMDVAEAPLMGMSRSADPRASEPAEEELENMRLADALVELQAEARRGSDRDPGPVDMWSRVEISPEITLSVRGLAKEDAPLLEAVARRLRRLIYGD